MANLITFTQINFLFTKAENPFHFTHSAEMYEPRLMLILSWVDSFALKLNRWNVLKAVSESDSSSLCTMVCQKQFCIVFWIETINTSKKPLVRQCHCHRDVARVHAFVRSLALSLTLWFNPFTHSFNSIIFAMGGVINGFYMMPCSNFPMVSTLHCFRWFLPSLHVICSTQMPSSPLYQWLIHT